MKSIIVREYLESLTERDELDYIFPILLEVMGYKIITTPKETKGLPQYGKDVVAIGIDMDQIKKRFYFEIKGGADRNVTTSNYSKSDGIRESILEAKDRPYSDSSNPDFNTLPVKIVLVHNGTLHASVKETFDGFIESQFKKNTVANPENFEFERWDIYELSELFTTYLFNEYLLTDDESLRHFKKVLVLINTPRNNYIDYFQLVNGIFSKAGNYKNLPDRKRLLFFETLNLVSFIIYSYSKDAGNLEPAKRCLPYSVLRLWHWILENELENDAKILDHFKKHFAILNTMLQEYFQKTLPIAKLTNGLWSNKGGRFEQIGFPMRAMDYLSHLILYCKCQQELTKCDSRPFINDLIQILNSNDGTTRPLVDNHSIAIVLILNYLIEQGRVKDAQTYLRNVLVSISLGWETYKRLPDGKNRIESVIRFIVTQKKSVFYVDETSHLIAILFEYLAVLDMETEYKEHKHFFSRLKLDLAVFVPYNDEQIRKYLGEESASHELHLFRHELSEEGFQSEITLNDEFNAFKKKTNEKENFKYEYRTEKVNMGYLITLAHLYYKTPFFPNVWRNLPHA